MSELEERLPTALAELGRLTPHDDDLANRVRAASRRRRLITLGPIAAVLAVVMALAGVWVSRPSTTSPAAAPPAVCAPLATGPLPDWARAGFSSPEGNPYVLGAAGAMAAIVFADPLVAPADPNRANKILWVAKQTPAATDTLVIHGTLQGSGLTHSVDIGTAPGPSYVDMPSAGCWQLTLTWGANSDTMNLLWSQS